MTQTIPFGRPQLDDAEARAVAEVLASGTLVHGPATHQFEERFAERAGVPHAVSVSSCTAGLHLLLFVNGIGKGRRVAVPAMTHVATAHVVELMGAEPVFVDVEADTGNIDPVLLETVAPTLDAAFVVHYLGLPCEMDRISELATRHGFRLFEDCALALDGHYNGVKAGALSEGGSFSFYPVKHMTSIEGGMVTTRDPELAARLRQCRAFGYDKPLGERAKPGFYDVTALGFNYRMNEAEAAVGLCQMDKLDGFQARRTENFQALADELSGIDELSVFPDRKGKAVSSHYCLTAVLPRDGSIDRDAVAADLKAQGIGTSIHYPNAVPLFTYYREKYGYKTGQFPVAEWIAAQSIALPVGPHVTIDDARRIGQAMKDAIRRVCN